MDNIHRDKKYLIPVGKHWNNNGKGAVVVHYYLPEEEDMYYERRGITLRNTKELIPEKELAETIGCSGYKVFENLVEKNVIKIAGKGRYKNSVSNYYRKSVVKKLEKHYGGPFLRDTKGLLSETEVRSMKFMNKIKKFYDEGRINIVGVKFNKTHASRYYKKKDVIKFQKKRAEKSS